VFTVRSTEGATATGLVSMSQNGFESASGAVCTKLKMLQDACSKMLYEQQRCILWDVTGTPAFCLRISQGTGREVALECRPVVQSLQRHRLIGNDI
jgi:hypothetical protein